VSLCACVNEIEYECVCMCMRDGSERESVRVCVRERDSRRFICVFDPKRERDSVSV